MSIAHGATIRGQLSLQTLPGSVFAICEMLYYLRSVRPSPVRTDEGEQNDNKLPEEPNEPLAHFHLSRKKVFFFAMSNSPCAGSS